ncbi:MAG: endonuclease Q family protein [Methanomicrobiales archaeon]|nr:endonuclease Q family protein [Methanomicrobiales archaeon]
MQLFCDLHIHSCFSIASSRNMLPDILIASCTRKGIGILGSGDALHDGWRKLWQERLRGDTEVLVVPTTEVEDRNRVHHLIILDSFDRCRDLQTLLAPHATNLHRTGRPHVRLSGEEIARSVHAVEGLIGPAHAFTPWTSLYASFDSPEACYGVEPIDFLELGLSADSSYGAAIPELAGIPFLSNSDAHSPDPIRLGREFTGISVSEETPGGVIDAIREGAIFLNAGFFPEEGKYNRTACSRCFRQFSHAEAEAARWKCPDDGGRITRGVADRAAALSTGHPTRRPPYLHIIPLGEIIRHVLDTSSPSTKSCLMVYDRFIQTFGDEIRVLTRIPVPDLARVDEGVARAIDAFRSARVHLVPGGGGRYGSFSFF